MKSNDHQDLVAQFIAKGGQVKTVPEGRGLNLSLRDWDTLARAEGTPAKYEERLVKLGKIDDPATLRAERTAEVRAQDAYEAQYARQFLGSREG